VQTLFRTRLDLGRADRDLARDEILTATSGLVIEENPSVYASVLPIDYTLNLILENGERHVFDMSSYLWPEAILPLRCHNTVFEAHPARCEVRSP